ncbi:MAG: dihydrofolate reductase, partial [Chitinophagaceae bacterium]
MRRIVATVFISMDGVMQGPGGPHEDSTNGFKWGGWSVHHWDDIMNNAMDAILKEPFDLLLGRKTYEIFAAHWPWQDDSIGSVYNKVRKYVVSNQGVELSWANSTLVTGDIVAEIVRLRGGEGPALLINGSSKLVQTLLSQRLIDELHLWTFPVTLGNGKRFFDESVKPASWKLTYSIISTTGVIVAGYTP